MDVGGGQVCAMEEEMLKRHYERLVRAFMFWGLHGGERRGESESKRREDIFH